MSGAVRVLHPRNGVVLWLSESSRSLLSLFFQQGKERLGICFLSFARGFFCRWRRVESSQMFFFAPLPLRCGYLFSLLFNKFIWCPGSSRGACER